MKKPNSMKKGIHFDETKGLDYFMSLNYPYTVEEYEEDGERFFSLSIPDLPGCGTVGKTIEEALKNLEQAKEGWFEVCLEEGLPIPEPVSEDEFSGKFLLRISPQLHMKLARGAGKEGKSLNQYIRFILEGNVNLSMLFQEQTKILLSRFSAFEKEFNIVSQRLESLESCYNKLSECLRSTYLWGGINYNAEFGLTEVIDASGFSQLMQTDQTTVVGYFCPKPRSIFPSKKAPEAA